jgi:crotonobetainyl-CoA:carnitine CoA-transferase CaiB-like acyl-CoA transferase
MLSALLEDPAMDKDEFFRDCRTDLPGPLAGVLVVEATTTWAGPMAGCILADYGARVIKIEHPAGEVARRLPPFVPGSRSRLSIVNETVNRNKESVTLDLSKPAGRDACLTLLARADVLIENFRPGTLASWGLGYAHVRAAKPDIVYVSVSGYGQYGPLSPRAGYDPLAQNFSGFTALNGHPGSGPVKAPTFLGDDLGGVHGALGALAALRHRDRTGEGQHVDVALLDSLLFQSNGRLTIGALGLPQAKSGNQFDIAAPVNAYACRDGHVFAGVLLDSHWKTLAAVIGSPALADDPRYAVLADRLANREAPDALLAAWCAERSVEEVVAILTDAGLPACRINTYADAARDPHVLARDMLQHTTLADGSRVPLTGPAAKFSRTPVRVRNPAETLGASTRKVLSELGYTDETIERMVVAGAI